MRYVIAAIDEYDDETGDRLYWSMDCGWVSYDTADDFSAAERAAARLPTGGRWEVKKGVPP